MYQMQIPSHSASKNTNSHKSDFFKLTNQSLFLKNRPCSCSSPEKINLVSKGLNIHGNKAVKNYGMELNTARKILEQQKARCPQKCYSDRPYSFQGFVDRRTCDYLLTFHSAVSTIMLRHSIQKMP